ncbi:MAG: mechanosensitive ion channel [Gammaproteobacteria bacterium]|nr:mechanosensitive ion channel [Gammaproteobacteria bacterium]
MQTLLLILQIAVIALLLGAGFYFANKRLGSYFASRPHLKFRYQLIQIGGILLAVLLVILFMPIGDTLRGQLLGLYGLIISATIALSSTTLVGNIMAGLMLKAIASCRPGDYITVGDYFGRISEMDLLHTEIQTEERDLTTLPNLYLVTHPVRVMRQSGTLLSVDVSLGYDVSRHQVEKLLIEAALDVGLESPYVQIRQLGDFSVSYQVSGLLTDVKNLIGTRRDLRARTMDILHTAGIEIVSPNFMNTRAIQKNKTFIAKGQKDAGSPVSATSPDSLIFDKAEKAESVSNLRDKLAEVEARIRDCDAVLAASPGEQAQAAATTEKEQLQQRAERLSALIARKEEKISKE